MAFGLREWVAAATLGCVGIAVWGLPPRPYTGPRQSQDETPERQAVRILERRIDRLNRHLKRVRWLRGVTPALQEARSSGEGVGVGVTEDLSPEASRRLEEAAYREAADLEPFGGEPAQVAVLAVDGRTGGHPQVEEATSQVPREYHILEDEGACVVLLPLMEPGRHDLRRLSRSGELLGPCAFYRRHGLPGGEVGRWMKEGGTAFAWSVPAEPLSGYRGGTSLFGIPGWFGLDDRYWRFAPAAYACLRGSVERCRQIFLDPTRSWRESFLERRGLDPDARLYAGWSVGPFSGLDRTLLADLRDEFGPERFHAFWTSEAPVEEAFQASFGAPVGSWVAGWARDQVGTMDRSRWIGVRAGALSLLTLGLLAGLAIRAARARTLE